MDFQGGFLIGSIVGMLFIAVVVVSAFSDLGKIIFIKDYKEQLDQCKSELEKQEESRVCQCDCPNPFWSTAMLWMVGIIFLGLFMKKSRETEDYYENNNNKNQDKQRDLDNRELELIKKYKRVELIKKESKRGKK